ncbi:unnamed protein product, partial [Prorocentrum cordatum]
MERVDQIHEVLSAQVQRRADFQAKSCTVDIASFDAAIIYYRDDVDFNDSVDVTNYALANVLDTGVSDMKHSDAETCRLARLLFTHQCDNLCAQQRIRMVIAEIYAAQTHIVTREDTPDLRLHLLESAARERQVKLLQPVVQPGVASSAGFAGLSAAQDRLRVTRRRRGGASGSPGGSSGGPAPLSGLTRADPDEVVNLLVRGAADLLDVITRDLHCNVAAAKSITIANSAGLRSKLARALGRHAGVVASSGRNLGGDLVLPRHWECQADLTVAPAVAQAMPLESPTTWIIAAGQAGEAVRELQRALCTAFSTPSLLNASFCFPGLYRPRLDAGDLLRVFEELCACDAFRGGGVLEARLVAATLEGLTSWAQDHQKAAALVHRDQLRGLPALLMSPIMADCTSPETYNLMARVMNLVAWMLPEGRRELQEVIIEDCSEEKVLRHCLVDRVRRHCDETLRRAHQAQRLSREIWEGLMLLQLLWSANEAIARRMNESLQLPPQVLPQSTLGLSLTQTLSQLGNLRHQSLGHTLSATQGTSGGADRLLMGSQAGASLVGQLSSFCAPSVRPPVPAAEFHLQ